MTKHKLIDTTNFFYKKNNKKINNNAVSDILSFCNGKNDVMDISKKCKLSISETNTYLNLLEKKKIIEKN